MPISGEKFVDVGGVRTRYFERGSGEIVVLVHGGAFGSTTGACCADDWDLNFDGLARWFRVFAIDKLGQGYTDNPRTDDDYTMHAAVQHAYATLRALGIEGAHLVGHSRGGYLVCRLTVEHPELVQSCTIVDSNTCAPGTGRNDFVFANMPKPALSAESQRWVVQKYSYSDDHISDAWIDAMVAVSRQPKYAEAVRKMSGDGFQWSKFLPGLQTQKEEMFRILRSRGIQRPVMQVWGSEDPTVSFEQAMGLYRILAEKERRARWQVFHRCGHYSFREHPKRFNEVIRTFIQAP